MGIDAERQERAKEYARIRHRLFALDLILSAVALLVVLFSGLSVWLRDIVLSISTNAGIATALYFIVGFSAYGLLYFPLTYYSGFVLQHRYGLSTQTLRVWLIDMLKGAILAIIFGTIVIEMIYFLLRAAPSEWWLITSALMLVFNVLLATFAPILIFPIFSNPSRSKTRSWSRGSPRSPRANTRVRGVYTIVLSEKTTAANAALMGLGNTRRIVLGDTLYEKYTHDKIETILAHELGHQVHHDIGWSLVVQTALTVAGFFIADVFLKWSVGQLHYEGIADLAALPLFGLALGVFGLITMAPGNAFSRWRESLADEYALESTHNAAAFIGAMEKLANQNLAELEPERWVEFLLYDHPPIGARLKRGAQFAAAHR